AAAASRRHELSHATTFRGLIREMVMDVSARRAAKNLCMDEAMQMRAGRWGFSWVCGRGVARARRGEGNNCTTVENHGAMRWGRRYARRRRTDVALDETVYNVLGSRRPSGREAGLRSSATLRSVAAPDSSAGA